MGVAFINDDIHCLALNTKWFADELKVITDSAGDVAALYHGHICVKHLKINY